mmetsp:Transcript_23221/g.92127  ORF Transcript_23221/g.92127 Transcript_23221/m.92127 type:complete len:253 (-) Transcript_23221:21-779(-)
MLGKAIGDARLAARMVRERITQIALQPEHLLGDPEASDTDGHPPDRHDGHQRPARETGGADRLERRHGAAGRDAAAGGDRLGRHHRCRRRPRRDPARREADALHGRDRRDWRHRGTDNRASGPRCDVRADVDVVVARLVGPPLRGGGRPRVVVLFVSPNLGLLGLVLGLVLVDTGLLRLGGLGGLVEVHTQRLSTVSRQLPEASAILAHVSQIAVPEDELMHEPRVLDDAPSGLDIQHVQAPLEATGEGWRR